MNKLRNGAAEKFTLILDVNKTLLNVDISLNGNIREYYIEKI